MRNRQCSRTWVECCAELLCCEPSASAVAEAVEKLQGQLHRAKKTIAKLHGKLAELQYYPEDNGRDAPPDLSKMGVTLLDGFGVPVNAAKGQ